MNRAAGGNMGGGMEEEDDLDVRTLHKIINKLRSEIAALNAQRKRNEEEDRKREKLERRLCPRITNPKKEEGVEKESESSGPVIEGYLRSRVKSLEATVRKRDLKIEELSKRRVEKVDLEDAKQVADDGAGEGDGGSGETMQQEFGAWRSPRDDYDNESETSVEDDSEEEELDMEEEEDRVDEDNGEVVGSEEDDEEVEEGEEEELESEESQLETSDSDQGRVTRSMSRERSRTPNAKTASVNSAATAAATTVALKNSRCQVTLAAASTNRSSTSTTNASRASTSTTQPSTSRSSAIITTKRAYSARRSEGKSKHHAIDHSKKPLVHCVCGLTFINQSNLKQHIRFYVDTQKFQCTNCSQHFFYFRDLKYHMRDNHNVNFQPGCMGCADCGAIFKCRADHKAHRLSVHPNYEIRNQRHGEDERFSAFGLFKCLCGRDYAQKIYLQEHLRRFINKSDFPCKICGRIYKTMPSLQCHSKSAHKKLAYPRGTVGCDECGKTFIERQEYRIHMRQVHNMIKWPKRPTLNQSRPHGERPVSSNRDQQGRERPVFRCLCGSAFVSKRLLRVHIRHMRPTVPFKCPKCPGEYMKHKTLVLHMRTVHKMGGYESVGCTFCGTSWPDKSALTRHQRTEHKANTEQ